MKKILSLLLAFVFVIGICVSAPITITANAASVDDLTFEINDEGTMYQVKDCNWDASGELVIPSTYNGLPVTRIGTTAFSLCESLTSITIPDSVRIIGDLVFYHCTSLTSVTIPDSVTSIGSQAFSGCTSLTSVTIPDSVTSIGSHAFSGCTSLTSVTIPDSVTSIDVYTFNGCTSLTSVTIGNGVTSIGFNAFYNCAFTSVEIPESVTYIGGDALGYKYDSWEETEFKIPDFTIYGVKGSEAEYYAIENGFTFIEKEDLGTHTHKYNEEVIKAATCTEAGTTKYSCSCGYIFTDTTTALGHDYSSEYTIDRVPSYQQAGEQSRHCSRCDARTDITVLPKLERFDPPVITKAVSEKTGVRLTWNPVDGVEGYVIFKLINGAYRSIATLNPSQTTYLDTEVDDGETYCYALASTNYIGDAGDYSEIAVTYKKIVSLSTPTATTKNTAQGIKITWGAVENAEKYVVYQRIYNKSTKKYSSWKAIKTTTETSYVDTSVKIGTGYSYAVRAVNGTVKSKYVATKGLTYNVTPTVKVANASNGIKVTWTKAANATGYTVYRSQYNTKTKKWSSWKNMGTAKANKTSWVDRSAKSGVTYKYTVRACNGSVKSKYKASANVLFLAQPKTTVKATSVGINVSWTQSAGAKGYTVYRSELVNGKWSSWKNMGTAKSNQKSWVDKSAQSGATYRYTVRAVNGNYKSSYTASGSVVK